jgi:alpha-N-arabinofuranosidase
MLPRNGLSQDHITASAAPTELRSATSSASHRRRQTVFYPSRPGRDWITVRGFRLRHAATPWAPPTAEQIGLIGTHWSRGWIIEDNTVTHSMCAGITLGTYGDAYDNADGTAEGYVGTIRRAQAFTIPWDREHIGGHVVRRNTVAFCEQAGICGS